MLTFSFRRASLTGRDTAREGAGGAVVSAMAGATVSDVTWFELPSGNESEHRVSSIVPSQSLKACVPLSERPN
jgi:hypothetical protein